MRVLLIFIDGLGIGTRGPHNPLDALDDAACAPLNVFQNENARIIRDGALAPTDACLGVAGRPQSASGQTTILTGINAPALLGYHKQGFPNERLREVIREHSIFRQLKIRGIEPNAFANAYSPRFFAARPRWVSATTVAVEAAGMPFRTFDDLNADAAVYHDITNHTLPVTGTATDVSARTPEQAAAILARLTAQHRFTLYEYFLTDRMGHLQDYAGAREVLSTLTRFLRALLDSLDLEQTTVLLTSDHGNIEDLSMRNHTLNRVPTLIWGAARERLKHRIASLTDITPAILEAV